MSLQAAKPLEILLQICLELLVPHSTQVGVETPPGTETGAPPHFHLPGGRRLASEGRGGSAGAGGAAGLAGRVWGRNKVDIDSQSN